MTRRASACRRRQISILSIAPVVIVALLIGRQAHAECIVIGANEVVEGSLYERVFSGTVKTITRTGEIGYRATFDVDRVWKGVVPPEADLYVWELWPETPRFEAGRKYIVLARRLVDPRARAGVGLTATSVEAYSPVQCSDAFSSSPENLRVLGPGRRPTVTPAPEGIQVSVSARAELTQGEPAIATLVVENASPHPITLNLGPGQEANIAISITTPDGTRRTVRVPPKDGLQSVGRVTIPASSTYVQQLLLNNWTTFTQLGRHDLAIELLSGPTTESGRVVSVEQPSPLQIVILPRDEAALVRTCERLARTTTQTSDVGERIFAARAVAAIQDPVAVPCLETLLARSDRDDWLLLPALGAIANPAALAALQSAASSDNRERAALAQDALRRAKRATGLPIANPVGLLQAGAAEPELHLIPDGYVGWVNIAYGAKNGQPGRYEDGARVYRIPTGGILITQAGPNRGTSPAWKFFYETTSGSRIPIRLVLTGSVPDTPANRSDPAIGVFLIQRWKQQAGRVPCDVEFDRYFVGTKAQLFQASLAAGPTRDFRAPEYVCR